MAKLHRKFNAQPFAYHAEFELEITTLTNLGVGLGRVTLPPERVARASGGGGVGRERRAEGREPEKHRDGEAHSASDAGDRLSPLDSGLSTAASAPPASAAAPASWVVMVPFALPGERVRVRVYRNHKNFSEADLVTVVRASPERIAPPPCPLFGRCGGCQYQHLSYAAQLVWKRQQVEELLRHMAGLEFAVAPVIGSPRAFGYRSKLTPHFGRPRPGVDLAGPIEEVCPIGFLRQGTRFDLVDVPQCLIATEAINARLPAARTAIQARALAGDIGRDGTLLLRDASGGVTSDYDAEVEEIVPVPPPGQGMGMAAGLADAHEPGRGERAVTVTTVAATAGEQASAPGAGDGATGPAAAPLRLRFLARDFFQNNPFILPAFVGYVRDQAAASGARFLVDAYCGSGLFALGAAGSFARVAGVEISASAVAFAQRNAAANGITNATFLAGDAGAIFAGLEFPAAETVVVIDPPRKGCDESFLAQLFAYGPRAVVYVSCDPATQMRDLRHCTAAGYELTAVQPFDLFPQTRHLECIVTLRRRGSGMSAA